MGFKLNFEENNKAEEGHYIYRSGSPMDPNDLPEPIAVLDADETEFEDGEVTPGETYYYRVAAFIDGGDVLRVSEELEIKAEEPDTVEAIFTFETESKVEYPVNWVEKDEGLSESLSVKGESLSWGITKASGETDSANPDVDPDYDIGWPADPVVTDEDYTIRCDDHEITFRITGLYPQESYYLSFVGSRSEGSPRTLEITIDGVEKSMNVEQNSTETLDFEDVKSGADGNIEFTFGAEENWGYLSAVYIKGAK